MSLRHFWERVVDGPIGAAALAGRCARGRGCAGARDRGARAIRSTIAGHRASGRRRSRRSRSSDACVRCMPCRAPTSSSTTSSSTPEILDRARRDAERIFVGKRRGQPGIGQDEINRRLVEAARPGPQRRAAQGRRSVHLRPRRRGARASAQRQRPVVVVPGITAALGCAAEAGLPLTFRNEASRLSLITAHRADEAAASIGPRWPIRRRPWSSTWALPRRPPSVTA